MCLTPISARTHNRKRARRSHIIAGKYERSLRMSVARVTELSSTSDKSFEDAVTQGIARATETLRNVRGAWIKEQEVQIRDGKISEYKVIMKITFVLDAE
jgi:flavin-binding protein dodecin